MRTLSVALVHHPVLNRQGERATTTITNLDLHDMARSVATYGAGTLFVVHPLESQRTLAQRIVSHWTEGSGRLRIPDRAPALARVNVVATLDEARGGEHGERALWTTAAVAREGDTTPYRDARKMLAADGPDVLLVFGTGWGLAPDVIASAELRLEPIASAQPTGYNHLSVRAACAISLDRLFG